jgi:hypothetical protein
MESSFLEPSMIRTYIPHVIYPYRVPYMWECGLAPSRPFVADHHLFCRSRCRNPGRVSSIKVLQTGLLARSCIF